MIRYRAVKLPSKDMDHSDWSIQTDSGEGFETAYTHHIHGTPLQIQHYLDERYAQFDLPVLYPKKQRK